MSIRVYILDNVFATALSDFIRYTSTLNLLQWKERISSGHPMHTCEKTWLWPWIHTKMLMVGGDPANGSRRSLILLLACHQEQQHVKMHLSFNELWIKRERNMHPEIWVVIFLHPVTQVWYTNGYCILHANNCKTCYGVYFFMWYFIVRISALFY